MGASHCIWPFVDAPCWFAFQCAALFRATVLAHEKRSISASLQPLGVYIYAFGSQSCATRLVFVGSARLRPKTKPRSASSGAGQTAYAFVSPFGEKRDSSRALHPPSAARYFVGGIPPSCLARVLWRITRTGVLPFPALAPHTCAVSPTFRYGAFSFVVFALADLSSTRLTTPVSRLTPRDLSHCP